MRAKKEVYRYERYNGTKYFERYTDILRTGTKNANKHTQYLELVVSQTVEFLVLACEEGGRWGPDVFRLVRDLVALKVALIHPLLRRSCALAYTRRWWSILAMGAQTAAVDCILNQDSPIPVPDGAPPLADIFHWADIAPEPSRIA